MTRFRSPLCLGVFTAIGALGLNPQADAAPSMFWPDSDPGVARATQPMPKRRLKARVRPAKTEKLEKQAAKPQGPLIISISIQHQKLKVYDNNGLFAETPISTGMTGHPTPLGVFSVIQKHKYHRSNIYSGAPMPYMQRITWSGIAMHAGVLPGYPASHGCIRMPMAFAVKMWGWTRMGARVVVTPGEIAPESFAHPLLITHKPAAGAESPMAAVKPAPADGKSDKASPMASGGEPAVPVAASAPATPALRTRIGSRPDAAMITPDRSRDLVRTANAGASLPGDAGSPTLTDGVPSDAKPSAAPDNRPRPVAPLTAAASPSATVAEQAVDADKLASDKLDAAVAEAIGAAPRQKSPEAAPASAPVKVAAAGDAGSESIDNAMAMSADMKQPEAKSVQTPASEAPKVADVSKGVPAAVVTLPSAPSGPETKTSVAATASDAASKDQTRVADPDKPVAPATASLPKRTGQISVFVSRKDGKLYVRQNFAPVFDVPITIAPSDRPLGTHIFTAEADKDDSFRWSVVSLPTLTRPELRDEDRTSRRRKVAGAVETKNVPQPNSAAEALSRLAIPADAMATITDSLTPGGSIIVSDQGIAAGETGEGTDFIIRLR